MIRHPRSIATIKDYRVNLRPPWAGAEGYKTEPWAAENYAFRLIPEDALQDCNKERLHVGGSIRCKCNESHSVVYSQGGSGEAADVHVTPVGGMDTQAPTINHSLNHHQFLFYIEPPFGLEFRSASNFNGVVGFRRPVQGDVSTVWYPFCSHQMVWQRVREWTFNPSKRTSIGIYHTGCDGYQKRWRTSVIDALLGSGLNAISYGECRRNTPKSLWGTRSGDGQCGSHRLMLAVENNACRDWVSNNLCQSLGCGAIPIVKSIWRDGELLPDYRALYGNLPILNASRPGWLAEAREIMTNDTYYEQKWKHAHRQHRRPPQADPGNFHCQWYGMPQHPTTEPVEATWSQCACPTGTRGEYEEERGDVRWLPTCDTPA